ncbi:MAG TPA: tyrosine-type recombinase/integrase [Chthoniobacterales bacterium]|jgi:integrase
MKKGSIPNLYEQRGKWYYAKQINGSRPFVPLNVTDEIEAIRMVRNLQRSPILFDLATGIRAEIIQFIARKRSKREYSPNSADTKALILNEFADWLPDKSSAAMVSIEQCKKFYAELQERVSVSTAEGYMMTLRSFFRWAVEVKRTRLDNPVAPIEIVRGEPIIKKQFVDKRGKNRLIENVPNDDLRFITFCGFDAGLRRGEISEARADWFELTHGGSVHVQRSIGRRLRAGEPEWRPKYNKERVIPLTRPFRAFLRRYLKGRDALDFALQPEIGYGQWRYRYDIRRPFTDYMAAQKMVWVTPHVMRHSFASNLKTAGISIPKIAEWLGDSERVTERTYAHLKPDDRDIHTLT